MFGEEPPVQLVKLDAEAAVDEADVVADRREAHRRLASAAARTVGAEKIIRHGWLTIIFFLVRSLSTQTRGQLRHPSKIPQQRLNLIYIVISQHKEKQQ